MRERVFPGLAVVLTAGLTGVFVTGDLFNFYVFFELAMTAAYVLATYGGRRRELGGALVFATVNLFGTFVFLISVAGVYHVTGTLDMAAIAARMGDVNPNAAVLIAVGFFVAFGVKLGLFPFHFWLPTVYTSAQPAVAAILSGGLANIGAYGLLRFGGYLLPDELELAATALIVVGAASILYGGVLAISRRTGAEMLAYSAIGQVGLRPCRDRHRRTGRIRRRRPLHDRERAQQDAAVPVGPDPRRARRRRVRHRSHEHRRAAARRGVRRQARAVPRRRGRRQRCSRCCSSAAPCRSSTPSRSTSTTSGVASEPDRAPAGRSRR